MEADLLALLAPIASGRSYYVRAPQGEPYPYLILNRASLVPNYTMAGANGLSQTRMQIDVYGNNWPSTVSTAQALQNLVSGFIGIVGSTRFQGIFIDAVRDLPASDAGDVTQLFRISIDIMIHHTAA